MTDEPSTERDKAFTDTVAHALLLHEKAAMLQQQVRESLLVAASLAGDLGCKLTDPNVMIDAVIALRSHDVPGRGTVTAGIRTGWAGRCANWQPGTTHVFSRDDARRGAPWPGGFTPCAYLLTNEHGEVIYVGKTTNLRTRMPMHSAKPWATVTVCICKTAKAALALEGDLIYQHQPPLNIQDRKTRRYVGIRYAS